MDQVRPNCNCGHSAELKYVQKQGPNHLRPFYGCASWTPNLSGCGFFKWVTASSPNHVQGTSVLEGKEVREGAVSNTPHLPVSLLRTPQSAHPYAVRTSGKTLVPETPFSALHSELDPIVSSPLGEDIPFGLMHSPSVQKKQRMTEKLSFPPLSGLKKVHSVQTLNDLVNISSDDDEEEVTFIPPSLVNDHAIEHLNKKHAQHVEFITKEHQQEINFIKEKYMRELEFIRKEHETELSHLQQELSFYKKEVTKDLVILSGRSTKREKKRERE